MADAYLGEIRLLPYMYAPYNWLPCDGRSMSIQQYTALFSILGVQYGGDGNTTFNLPDLRGRVAIGQGQGPGLSNYACGNKVGVESVQLQPSQAPSHSHSMLASTAGGSSPDPSGGVPASNIAMYKAAGNSEVAMNAQSLSTVGQSQGHNNMAPSLAVQYCICVEGGEYPVRS